MKSLLKTIGHLIFIGLVSFIGSDVSAQNACTFDISNSNFTEITGDNPNLFNENNVNLKLQTENCEDGIKLKLRAKLENKDVSQAIDDLPTLLFPDNTGFLNIKFKLQDSSCDGDNNSGSIGWDYECINYIQIYDINDQLLYSPAASLLTKSSINSSEKSTLRENGILVGDCSGFCSGGNWDFVTLFKGHYPCIPHNAKLNAREIGTPALRFSPEELVSGAEKIVVELTARSINDACTSKPNAVSLFGAAHTENNTQVNNSLNFIYPDSFNDQGSGSFGGVNSNVQIPISNFCDADNNCSFSLGYTVDEETVVSQEGLATQGQIHVEKYLFQCSSSSSSSNDLVSCDSNITFQVKYRIQKETDSNSSTNNFVCTVDPDNVVWVNSNDFDTGGTAILDIQVDGDCDSALLFLRLQTINPETGEITLGNEGVFTNNRIDLKSPYDANDDVHQFTPPADGKYQIQFKTDTEECTDQTGYDCLIGIVLDIDQDNTQHIFKTEGIKLSDITDIDDFDENVNGKKGLLYLECADDKSTCPSTYNDWTVIDENGTQDSNTVPEETTPIQFFDKNSPCYVEIGQGNSENGVDIEKEGYIEDCYEFLAPIPGFETTDRADKNNLIIEGNRVAIRDVKELKLGDYINSMFQIALGVLMVLSVVMIVVAGVQYMTVESFYGKSDAKKRISGALMGLILSLGIVIILNTINPRLLEINFGEGIESVTINVKTIDLGYLNSIDVAGIPDVDLTTMLQNEAFVLYIAHQQGKGGASAIFHSVKNNSNKVITSKYTSSPEKIQANVDNQFKKPTNLDDFLNYFYKRIIKFTNDTTNRDNIPQQYKDAIQQAASAQGVNYGAMITMCMIESYLCNQSPQGIPAHLVDNGQGYRGLFQFGEAAWADYGKAPYLTNVVIATENALAGAKMFRANVGIKDLF